MAKKNTKAAALKLSDFLVNKIKIVQPSPPVPGKPLLSWKANEFYFVDKSTGWGIVVVVLFLALATALTVFGQLLVAVVLLLFLVNIIKFAYAKPETIEYRIDHDGVRVANWLHAYDKEIIAYALTQHGRQHVLVLKTRGLWTDHLTLPIGSTSPKKIANVLDDYLPAIVSPLEAASHIRTR